MSSTGRLAAAAVGTLLILGGCSFGDEALGPSLTGPDPVATEPAPAPQAEPLALGTGTFEPTGVTPGAATGTLVGQKVQELRGDLQRLQNQLGDENVRLQTLRSDSRQSAAAYHNLRSTMNARLQVGTTPGNPELVAMWTQAQTELSKVDASINNMNALANDATSTSSLAAFLLESTRATFGLSGAVDEDHRQLAILEDEVNQTVVLIDRLLNELTEDIARQSLYLSNERSNLTAMSLAIKNGEYVGVSLANRAFGVPAPPPPGGAAGLVGRAQPLVVIRFDRANPDYEQALFSAISNALQRRPNAGFDLVAVAPGQGDTARVALAAGQTARNAERVLRSLTTMGLPADRVSLSSTTNPASSVGEVHVYVR